MKLPISMPAITSHHFYALPLAIIGSSQATVNWIYSEFVQLFTSRNKEDNESIIHLYNYKDDMFKYEPLDDSRILPKRLIYGESIIDTYKRILDCGQYIYDFVDKYYIKSFQKEKNYIHDLLLYGYDDDKKIFNVFAFQTRKLIEFEIPYDEYIAAYNSEYMASRFHLTILYRLKDKEYGIDIKKIGYYLLDYMEGINTYNRESLHDVVLYKPRFGIEIYDEIKDILKLQHELKMEVRLPDIYCLYDHKRFMVERAKYLNEHSTIKCSDEMLEEFKAVEQEAQYIVMLSIKVNKKSFNGKTDIKDLLSHIDILKEKEKTIYTKYYENNKEVFNNG